MTEASPRQHRKSIRLPEFDYAGNATYFLTICTAQRIMLFGTIVDGLMNLNEFGRIAEEEILESIALRPGLDIHHQIVMPNHVHLLLTMTPEENSPQSTNQRRLHRPRRSLGSFVAGYKSVVTTRINTQRGVRKVPVWQPNYYEHVVRNERAFELIWDYIEHNPASWADDGENPASPKFRQ